MDPAGESRHPGVDPWHSGQSALVTGGDDPDLHPVAGVLLLVEETAAAVTLAGVSPSLLQAGTHEGVVNLNSGGRPFSPRRTTVSGTYVLTGLFLVSVPLFAEGVGNDG